MADQFINAMTQTWNEGGTSFAAIKMNVTDAASQADSRIIDLQVGGVRKFGVQKDGSIFLTSNDVGASGPALTSFHDSASPTANDQIFRWLVSGRDSGGNVEDYAEAYVRIDDATDASEDASWVFRAKVAGTMTTLLTIDASGISGNGIGTAASEDIGTSGATVPLLNAANTWSALQSFDQVAVGPNLQTTDADIQLIANGNIASEGNLNIFIDSDNGGTTSEFAVYRNATGTTAGTRLMAVEEINGDITADIGSFRSTTGHCIVQGNFSTTGPNAILKIESGVGTIRLQPDSSGSNETTITSSGHMTVRGNIGTIGDVSANKVIGSDFGRFNQVGSDTGIFGTFIGGQMEFRPNGINSGTNQATLATNGNFTAAGNITADSDERLKKDWEGLPIDFVERLSRLKSGTYTRTDTDLRQVGVGAQSLREFLPEAVIENDEGILSVAYGNAALVACVELAKRIVALEAKI